MAGTESPERPGAFDRSNAGHARTLPLPATYVIDRQGTIRWAFVNTDYTTRAEPADILAALDALD
jgi:peroxiredoxin